MNLIEQLGGYEIKIPDYECYQYHKESLETYEATKHLSVFGMTAFRANLVRKSILQYRREHNIFEVGDKYVMLKIWHDDLMVVSNGDMDEPYWNTRIIRHATPQELEAGHRL